MIQKFLMPADAVIHFPHQLNHIQAPYGGNFES